MNKQSLKKSDWRSIFFLEHAGLCITTLRGRSPRNTTYSKLSKFTDVPLKKEQNDHLNPQSTAMNLWQAVLIPQHQPDPRVLLPLQLITATHSKANPHYKTFFSMSPKHPCPRMISKFRPLINGLVLTLIHQLLKTTMSSYLGDSNLKEGHQNTQSVNTENQRHWVMNAIQVEYQL